MSITKDEVESSPAETEPFDPGVRRGIPTWHRGDTANRFPQRIDFFSDTFLQDYVLKGWAPPKPVITRETRITAFGSCFAANITRHLGNIGFDLSNNRDPDIYISRIGDGLVNTASILGQFEWALENKVQPQGLWHGFKAEGFGYDEDIRLRTRAMFLETEFFIITLGLSEVWTDAITGGTFWRAVPQDAFDPKRHSFRVMSMAETKADIARIYEIIRTHVPRAKVLFTISPIPLAATFRDVSCMTANNASKAILRAALDEIFRDKHDAVNDTLFYFPSMEIVQFCFADPWGMDCRHPSSPVLDTIMKTFEATFCASETTLEDANAMFLMFRAHNMEKMSKRAQGGSEKELSMREARAARRAGVNARRKAKKREIDSKGAGTSKKLDKETTDSEISTVKDTPRSAKRARRREMRKSKKRAGPKDGEE